MTAQSGQKATKTRLVEFISAPGTKNVPRSGGKSGCVLYVWAQRAFQGGNQGRRQCSVCTEKGSMHREQGGLAHWKTPFPR